MMIIEHIDILKQHNHWRRCNDENCDCKMVNVKKLGCAIDAAIDVMQECSDTDAKLKIAREALKAIILGQTTRDHELMLSTVGMATIAKQALEKTGENDE